MKKIKSLSEQVYDYIINQIKFGELLTEAKLVETDLIEQLNISRTPIREALIQLAADGVLENVPRKGFFVRKFDKKEITMNYRIIAQLDAYAGELSMDYLTETNLKEMEALARRMDLAIEDQNYKIYTDEQEVFHNIYLEKCENVQLIDLIHNLQNKYIRTAGFSSNKDKLFKLLAAANVDHYNIIQFFREKNIEKLKKTLVNHWQIVQKSEDADYF